MVENGGIIGRGVLSDYHAWAEAKGMDPPSFDTTLMPSKRCRR